MSNTAEKPMPPPSDQTSPATAEPLNTADKPMPPPSDQTSPATAEPLINTAEKPMPPPPPPSDQTSPATPEPLNTAEKPMPPPSDQTSPATPEPLSYNSFLDAMKKKKKNGGNSGEELKEAGYSDEELKEAFRALPKVPKSDSAVVSAEVLRLAVEHLKRTVESVKVTIRYIVDTEKVEEQIQITEDQFVKIVKSLEEPTVAEQAEKAFNILSRGEGKKIVLYGKAGVGKTWMAGKIAGRARREFGFTVWYLNRTYEGMSLYESIAYQLSVPFEESEEYKKESENLKKKKKKEMEEKEEEKGEKEEEKEEEKETSEDIENEKMEFKKVDEEVKWNLIVNEKMEFEKKVREAVKVNFENKIRGAIQGKKLLMILDDEGRKERLEWTESQDEDGKKKLHFKLDDRNVGEIRGLDPAKSFSLITSRDQPSTTDSYCIGIKVGPWTWEESESVVFNEVDKSNEIKKLAKESESVVFNADERKKLAEFFIRKSGRLPPEILIIGRVVSTSGLEKLQKDKEVLEKEEGSKVCDALIKGYERLPKSVLMDCYSSETPESTHFLHRGGMVNFNELICYWILEGHLGHFERIEDAYEEGHRVLMELIYCGLLEKLEGNNVAPTGPMFSFDIDDRNEFYRKVHSGLGLTYDMKLGAVAWGDGMIRTVGSNGRKKSAALDDGMKRKAGSKGIKMSTFIIDGDHIGEKDAASSLFEPKSDPENGNATELEMENIVIFNPTCHHFRLPIQKMVNLRLLALRGCRFLNSIKDNFDWKIDAETDPPRSVSAGHTSSNQETDPPRSVSAGHTPSTTPPQEQKIEKMDKMTVLEISGPSPVKEIPDNLFSNMLNLKTVNMSGLLMKTLPTTFYQLTQIEFLILRGCLELEKLESLRNFKGLQVLDVSGSISFAKFQDKNLHLNSKLQILNLSRTNLKTIPLINSNPELKFVSVSDCPILQRIRKIDKLGKLEVFDMSGAKEVEQFCNPSLEDLDSLAILDVSRTAIIRLPSNVSNPRFFRVRNCSKLKRLPPIEEFTKVEAIDLSDSYYIEGIRKEFFSDMVCLRELNLSRTKIKHLPCLRTLRRLRLSQCDQFEELENWSSLEELEYLDLSGCKALKEMEDGSFEKMKRLMYLNLSGTPLPQLPSLSKLENLKELYVRDCPNLTTLPGVEGLPLLETLDYSGTILSPPPSFSNPDHPKVLGASLANIDHPQLLEKLGASSAAGDSVQSDSKEDFRICMWKISNWQATIDKNTPDSPAPASVYGIHFLHLLNKYPSLMEKLSQFHFLVYPTEAEAKFPKESYRNERSLRDIYFEQLPLEKLERRLEIRAFDTCPPFIGRVLEHAQFVALVADPFLKSLLDLCRNTNIKAMKACWIEKCDELEYVIAEENKKRDDLEHGIAEENKKRDESEHVIAEENKKRDESEHVIAEENKKRDESEHVIAEENKKRAEENKKSDESEHVIAEENKKRDESEHVIAEENKKRAEENKKRDESEHVIAEENKKRAEENKKRDESEHVIAEENKKRAEENKKSDESEHVIAEENKKRAEENKKRDESEHVIAEENKKRDESEHVITEENKKRDESEHVIAEENKKRAEENKKRDESEHVIAEENKNSADVLNNLETLWISDSLKVKSILKEDIKSNTFKSIKHLYLEYCPELTMICSTPESLESLESLNVKYCRKIKRLFTEESPQLKKLTKLVLRGLPQLERMGCNAPSLITLTVLECPLLEHVIEAANEADEKVSITATK